MDHMRQRDDSIRRRVTVIYVGVSAVTFIVIALVFLLAFTTVIIDEAQRSAGQLASQTAYISEEVAEDLASLVLLETRNLLRTFSLRPDDPFFVSVGTERLARRLFLNLSDRSELIKAVYVQFQRGSAGYIDSAGRSTLPDTVDPQRLNELVEEARHAWGAPLWIPFAESNGDTIAVARSVFNVDTLDYQGFVLVFLDARQYLARILQGGPLLTGRLALYYNGQLMVDSGGSVDQRGRTPSGRSISAEERSPSGTWTVVRSQPVRELLALARVPLILSVAAYAVSVIAAMVTARLTTRSIQTNIANMVEQVGAIEGGKFGHVVAVEGDDELAQLAESVNRMSTRLRSIVDDLAEEHSLAERNRLDALRARFETLQLQISPHFLYNVLESINSVAKLEDAPEISRIVVTLGRVLRQLLHQESEFWTLAEEIDSIKDLVFLYQLTLGRRIALQIDKTSSQSATMIPRLLLQPIVENCVVHGFQSPPDEPSISVTAQTEADVLLLEVADNGGGLESMDPSGNRIGLANVQERIVLLYGEEASVRVVSNPGAGTRVTVKIKKELPEKTRFDRNDRAINPRAAIHEHAVVERRTNE